MIMSTSH
jgi:hypothetical protein